MTTKTKHRNHIMLIILIILVSFTLTGCVSDKKKQEMFDMLRDQGYIEVENRKWNEFDEEKTVNQAPIPVNITYYIYRMDDVTYTINYSTVSNDIEHVDTFKAHVEVEKSGDKTFCEDYIFENRQIFGPFWKMYFIGKE